MELACEADIHCPAQTIFDLIVDLRVTEFERPTRVAFHQPMTMRLHAGTVDILMRYTLTPAAGSTHVRRVVAIDIPRPLTLLQPVLVRAIRSESGRTLHALKAYADSLG